MTRLQAAGGTGTGKKHSPTTRLLVGAPLVALLTFLCLISLSFTGWGVETDPAAQLLRDAPWVVLAGLTGAGAGTGFAWTLFGRRSLAMTIGTVLGALPAALMVTAYFTDAY